MRWSRKTGLQLIHPRLGKLKTSLKSGCPQLGREQALQLVRELESARLKELAGRLQRVQAQLKVTSGVCFNDVLDAFVTSGSYSSALAFARFVPFLSTIPQRVVCRLCANLSEVNGWEALKGLPFNRRTRKRLHQSHAWVLHLGANVVDPSLKQLCQAQGLELIALDNMSKGLLEPKVWTAMSWAAFSGRILAVVGDSPMRTWGEVQVAEGTSVRLRSAEHPWGEPGIKSGLQNKVDDDTLLGVMPMWLWTLASIAKGEGVPFCQTCALQGQAASGPWLQQVVTPFANWSNSREFVVQSINEGVRQTIPGVHQSWILQHRGKIYV